MFPELFTIPFLNISIKSYGFMMVVGFILALWMARWRCRKLNENPDTIVNFAVWSLVLGVIGARLFHVVHYWELYKDDPKSIFAVWSGGLEFLGGFMFGIAGLVVYCKIKKVSVLKIADILAPSVMIGLALGRIGCLFNGCCYGDVCEKPWAVTFPAVNVIHDMKVGSEDNQYYRYSPPYQHQLEADFGRNPDAVPLITLPDDFYDGYSDGQYYYPHLGMVPEGVKVYRSPKSPNLLTPEQRDTLGHGDHAMHPIHPTQIYSFFTAIIICIVLNILFERRKYVGQMTAFLLILYGPTRFFLESLRSDNPIEFTGFTVSQNLGILSLIIGLALHFALRNKTKITHEE